MVCCKVTFPKEYCCQKRCKADCLYARNNLGTTFNPEFDVCPYYIPITDKQYNEIQKYDEKAWVRFKQDLVSNNKD